MAPNLPRVAGEYFGFDEIIDFMIRRKKVKVNCRDSPREFDALVVCRDKVILNETKSNPKTEYIKDFVKFIKSGEFHNRAMPRDDN